MSIIVGSKVEQIIKSPIVGNVIAFSQDQYDGGVMVMVEWKDESGQVHRRAFKKDEVKEVE